MQMAFPRLTFDSVANGLARGEWEKQRLLLTGGQRREDGLGVRVLLAPLARV